MNVRFIKASQVIYSYLLEQKIIVQMADKYGSEPISPVAWQSLSQSYAGAKAAQAMVESL